MTTTFFLGGTAVIAFLIAETSPYQKPAHDAANLYWWTLAGASGAGVVTLALGGAGLLLLPTSEE
ncbi:MAG: hypothetical protein GY822_01760 [Deltaproteobacteria bacterium]|nr:hypothetical protein [Deltaproteobacteria bacterium]